MIYREHYIQPVREFYDSDLIKDNHRYPPFGEVCDLAADH